MSKPLFEATFEQLSADSVILTPNRRLATVIHGHYMVYQQKQGRQGWQKPAILSLSAWLESLWQHYLTTTTKAPYLLSTPQANALWESIISSDPSHHLLQVADTAEALSAAWALIHQYKISLSDAAFQLTEDYARCQAWLQQYQSLCEQHHYLDHALLPEFLSKKMTAGDIALPGSIFLYGFTEIAPAYEALLSHAVVIKNTQHSEQPNEEASTLTLSDADSEIIAMARFAKAMHAANPDAKIGCVVLDLTERRERTLQLFTQVFFPDHPYDIQPIEYPFNMSAGKKLASYPLIATALTICGLTQHAITRDQFSALLLSPYIGDAESEASERAKLDAALRHHNVHLVQLNTLPPSCSKLSQRIKQVWDLIDNKKRSYREWSQHFNNMLQAFGWPGEQSLSSEEYQVAGTWLTVLNDFASLDKIATPASKATAWQHLRQIVSRHIFQPESPPSNIQILGLLEAAAVPFDYLWVAGMNDTTWPPQPKPHPFIPKPLQRELNMPHATAERELHFCLTILKQFHQSATRRIFSHAKSDGKIEFKTSSLLQHLPSVSLSDITQADFTAPADKVFDNKQMNTFIDNKAPAIHAEQKITGGADIIKQQAACPFKAVAIHRLHARELETSTQGLNAKDRGIILHAAMELIWDELRTQQNILMMDDETLQALINHNIDAAVNNNAPPHHRDTQYLSLEKTRLAKLITQWLALEKSRPPFEVSKREQAASITLHNRQLSVRIDRIDTLENGKKLVIDYKTGANNSVNKWFGDRPDEPQLPLYTLLDPANTAGITFAQVAAGKLGFKGIASEALQINGIQDESATWPEKLAQWQATLEKLLSDYVTGVADVNPKRPAVTCKNCAITPLCRIHDFTDPDTEEDEKEMVNE